MNKTIEALLARIEKLEAAAKLAEEALEDAYRRDEHAAARWVYEQALDAIREALQGEENGQTNNDGITKLIDDWGRRLDIRYPDAVIITGDQMREAMQEEIDELREALAEPVKQEPVALLDVFSGWSDIAEVEIIYNAAKKLPDGEYKLYAAPVSAKREWVDLTDDEVAQAYRERTTWVGFAHAVIAKFKEKNK